MNTFKLKGAISMLNRVPALRRILKPGPMAALASMGGVGSTALGRHIGSIADKTIREHAYSPKLFDNVGAITLGYIYGNPYNSVLSIFRRGYQSMHAKAMNANSGNFVPDLRDVSLEEFLDRGIDDFQINRQLTNWTDLSLVKYPTILIKYEKLAENIDEVLAFFNCKTKFEIRVRDSAWENESANIKHGLMEMYGQVQEKIDAMPSIKVLPVTNQ